MVQDRPYRTGGDFLTHIATAILFYPSSLETALRTNAAFQLLSYTAASRGMPVYLFPLYTATLFGSRYVCMCLDVDCFARYSLLWCDCFGIEIERERALADIVQESHVWDFRRAEAKANKFYSLYAQWMRERGLLCNFMEMGYSPGRANMALFCCRERERERWLFVLMKKLLQPTTVILLREWRHVFSSSLEWYQERITPKYRCFWREKKFVTSEGNFWIIVRILYKYRVERSLT